MSEVTEWKAGWREDIWSRLAEDWDLIVVGGGITGAGILQEAVRAGYKVLLVEAQDFSSGTSSRSSKLVHGGFRYMANAQFKLTYESVHERERLLADGKGLVNHLDILFPDYPENKVPGWAMGIGFAVYSLMAGKFSFRYLSKSKMEQACQGLNCRELRGGYRYYDANTDDARLTLRVIREAVSDGGVALNYARVVDLLRNSHGEVCGVVIEDEAKTEITKEVEASLVINATGAWGDVLRRKLDRKERIRPLQGSHLILPYSRLPVKNSVSFFHPRDGRPVFTLPWEGVTLVGTTDLDVGQTIADNPEIQDTEVDYLLDFLQFAFPGLEIEDGDILCTMSGIRPVIDTGKADPSKESREHAIWLEDKLLTVTGGKLTTFRIMARDVLRVAMKELGNGKKFDPKKPLFRHAASTELVDARVDPHKIIRLAGRYGADSFQILDEIRGGGGAQIGATPYLWAELDWAARMEGVVHLDDLLLRRVRLGMLLPEGGRDLLPKIREIAQPGLGWEDQRWAAEESRYLQIWEQGYRFK